MKRERDSRKIGAWEENSRNEGCAIGEGGGRGRGEPTADKLEMYVKNIVLHGSIIFVLQKFIVLKELEFYVISLNIGLYFISLTF